MTIGIYQLSAFATNVFDGNPAAVCPLDGWLDDELMQAIAAENNLSETAFVVRTAYGYGLRWFTPTVEVDLCGHATLATAWVVVNVLGDVREELRFATRSGDLTVRQSGPDRFEMSFPSRPPRPEEAPAELLVGLGLEPGTVEVLAADDWIVVVDSASIVRDLNPDLSRLRGLPRRGVAVTAPGEDADIVTRWFGPNVGVDEDPVTGSAHTALAPYWANRLGRARLTARQGGRRKGVLECEVAGDRVLLRGQVVPFMTGQLSI